jgi:hypothetical protein
MLWRSACGSRHPAMADTRRCGQEQHHLRLQDRLERDKVRAFRISGRPGNGLARPAVRLALVDPLPDDHTHFVGVLDTGHWMTGRIEREAQGRLSGLADVEITPMRNRVGQSFEGKGHMDAEGVALHGDRVLVSFEQQPSRRCLSRSRLRDLAAVDTDAPCPSSESAARQPRLRDRGRGAMDSPLKGGTLIVAERSLDDDGNAYAAILDGPLKGKLALAHYGDFDATDGAFLPNGDLLLLERRFNMAEGIGMRIRRIKSSDIRPGAVMDGEILLQGDFGYQIDNMEGLDAFRPPTAPPMLSSSPTTTTRSCSAT